MKNIVILSGAGISAESGLKTFRDSGGLWEGHRPEEVATPEAFMRRPEMVLKFYNHRRAEARAALPNSAHFALAELEKHFNVEVITQNVDDLHERAGSSRVHHLHGSLFEARSSLDPALIYPIEGNSIEIGQRCTLGSQLRPNIVWFGEPVPMMEFAMSLSLKADIFIVVGTSLAVYPAASLLQFTPPACHCFIVDPIAEELGTPSSSMTLIGEKAGIGVPTLVKKLLSKRDQSTD